MILTPREIRRTQILSELSDTAFHRTVWLYDDIWHLGAEIVIDSPTLGGILAKVLEHHESLVLDLLHKTGNYDGSYVL